jgi:hypothetical protein
MRTIALMSAAATILGAAAFAPDAKADRLCHQVCEAGFCQTYCSDSDHVYLDDRDKDFYLRHGRPDVFTGQ